MHTRPLHIAALLMLLTALLSGCKEEEVQRGIRGTVSVDGGSAAGDSVLIYDMPVFAETSVWTITQRNPAVGFPFRLQAAFDWRFNTPRAATAAGNDGSFRFDGFPDGDYVLVAFKPGYGWSVPQAVTVAGQTADAGTLRLQPEFTLPGNAIITENTRWLAGRHYVLAQNLTVNNGVTLTIEPGAVVRVGDGGRIQVFGNIVADGTPDAHVVFTSNQRNSPLSGDWRYILFASSADQPPRFRYCTFSFCEFGVRSLRPGGTFEFCLFSRIATEGADLTGNPGGLSTEPIILRNNVVDDRFPRVPVGLRVVQHRGAELTVEKNAIFGCLASGLQLEAIVGGTVHCNWFFNCGRSDTVTGVSGSVIDIGDIRGMTISNNEVHSSPYGLGVGSRVDSTVIIQFNRFSRLNRVMDVGVTQDRSGPSNPTFADNCISNCDRNIFINSCHINYRTINAPRNFWGTSSEATINSRNWDCIDVPGPVFPCPCVHYNPFLTSCNISGVGICLE